MDFCLIFVPFGHYDEPEILRYAITSICPIGADVRQTDIRSLHGTTVAEIFSSGLDNLEEIEAVAVSVLWKDGRVTAGASNITNDRLALMVLTLDEHQRQAFRE